jgi:hypothetical protein
MFSKSVQWQPGCSVRTIKGTDGQKDMTKFISAYSNFAKDTKNNLVPNHTVSSTHIPHSGKKKGLKPTMFCKSTMFRLCKNSFLFNNHLSAN